MMQAMVDWRGGMVFEGVADSGFPIQLDADPNAGGNHRGARPMELIMLGLAGCTAMDVISILQKKRQVITDFQVKVDAARAHEHPKAFIGAVIHYVVTGKNVNEQAVLRAIELSATRYCPAQAMLAKAFPMVLRYEIYEDEGDGEKRLAKQGVCQVSLS